MGSVQGIVMWLFALLRTPDVVIVDEATMVDVLRVGLLAFFQLVEVFR